MKFKPDQCESFTRSSQYTVRCKRKGFFCKTSKKYRCPNHAGLSTGPKTKEGKLKALQNLERTLSRVHILLEKIHIKTIEHSQKWFGRWRRLNVSTETKELMTEFRLLEKRFNLLHKVLMVYKETVINNI